MNCPYCNNKMLPSEIFPNIQLVCDECYGKPKINNWNIVAYNQFILTDLYVNFTIDINHRSYRVLFSPAYKNIIISHPSQEESILLKINDIITPRNVYQTVQRVLSMKAFL